MIQSTLNGGIIICVPGCISLMIILNLLSLPRLDSFSVRLHIIWWKLLDIFRLMFHIWHYLSRNLFDLFRIISHSLCRYIFCVSLLLLDGIFNYFLFYIFIVRDFNIDMPFLILLGVVSTYHLFWIPFLIFNIYLLLMVPHHWLSFLIFYNSHLQSKSLWYVPIALLWNT